MQPSSVSSFARWAADLRGEGRAVRVAAHVEGGFLVISMWKADVCVGTVRLVPHEAAELMAGMAHGLAEIGTAESAQVLPGPPVTPPVAAGQPHDTTAMPPWSAGPRHD